MFFSKAETTQIPTCLCLVICRKEITERSWFCCVAQLKNSKSGFAFQPSNLAPTKPTGPLPDLNPGFSSSINHAKWYCVKA